MTEVKIISKQSPFVVENVNSDKVETYEAVMYWEQKIYIAKDEIIETLMYWVQVALAAYSEAFAQFQYSGRTYVVSIDK